MATLHGVIIAKGWLTMTLSVSQRRILWTVLTERLDHLKAYPSFARIPHHDGFDMIDAAIETGHAAEREAIEIALSRLQTDHQFGCCVRCGAQLDFDQLLAFPATVQCAACDLQRWVSGDDRDSHKDEPAQTAWSDNNRPVEGPR